MPTRHDARRWEQVTAREYDRLVDSAIQGQATLLDQYGASSRAEFFAVASECFFCRPRALRGRHPDLYALLRTLYGQDPATWVDDSGPVDE
jgi:MtfA peptidase